MAAAYAGLADLPATAAALALKSRSIRTRGGAPGILNCLFRSTGIVKGSPVGRDAVLDSREGSERYVLGAFLSRHFGDTFSSPNSPRSARVRVPGLTSRMSDASSACASCRPRALPRGPVATTRRATATGAEHDAIVRRGRARGGDGVPYMVLYENAGWTLDQLLAAVRSLGVRIPVEYRCGRRADRRRFEHACWSTPRASCASRPLLPDVSISHDAQVRVGGFVWPTRSWRVCSASPHARVAPT